MNEEVFDDYLEYGEEEANTDFDPQFFSEIMDVYNDTLEAWQDIRNTYEENIRFSLLSEQWDEEEKSLRSNTGRSVTTYNKLASNIRYVVNNFISNPPSIKIHPKGSNANKNTAEVLDGIVKYIQYNSDATSTYATALQNVLAGGIGAWRVIPRASYYDENKIELHIDKIADTLSVLIDPNAKKPNFSDMEFCFIINRISHNQFNREFPEYKDTENPINREAGWADKSFVQIGEYWRKINIDGKIVIEQYLFDGARILSKTEIPGTLIPIVFVVGEEIRIGSDRKIKCLISDVKDAQRILNYTKSEIVDSIQKTNKTKYLVDFKTISDPGAQAMWNNANKEAYPYLPYDSKAGDKPTIVTPSQIPSEYIEGASEAGSDIQFGMGIPNPLTEIPQTQSGKAISLQLSQKNLQTFNFINNINLGIRYTGEILLDLIRYYYTEEDIMQILGIDGQINSVQVNSQYVENGKEVYHDLTKSAEYKCQVSIGPSYTDKRAEALEVLSSLSKEMPIVGQTAADLIIQNVDCDNADAIARRIRAGMNPQIIAATNPTNTDDTETLKANTQQLQVQLQQSQQIIQQLQSQLKQVSDQNNLKIQLEQMKQQHEEAMAIMNTKFKREEDVFKTEQEVQKNKQEIAHELAAKTFEHSLDIHSESLKHEHNKLELDKQSENKIAENLSKNTNIHIIH